MSSSVTAPCPAPTPAPWRRCRPPGRRRGTPHWRAGCPAWCGRGRPASRGSGLLGRRRPRTCSGPRASTRSPRRASTASRRRRPARRHKQHLPPVGRRCRLPRLRLHRVSRRLPDAQRRRSGRDCPPNSGSRDKLGAFSPLARTSECLYSCLGLRPQVVIGVRLQGEREPQGESSRFCQVCGTKRTVLSLSHKADISRVSMFCTPSFDEMTDLTPYFNHVIPAYAGIQTVSHSANQVEETSETGSTANFSLGSLSIGNRSGLPPSPPTLSRAAECWAIGAERKPRAMGR